MKRLVLVALVLCLSVAGYIGWTIYAKSQQEKTAHELMEGYDRCIAPLDESMTASRLNPTWNNESPEAKNVTKAWMDARNGCREFYFGGRAMKSAPRL